MNWEIYDLIETAMFCGKKRLMFLLFLMIYCNNVKHSLGELPDFTLERDKILIIPVEFPNCRFKDFKSEISILNNTIFDEKINPDSLTMKSYFLEVSYNTFNLTADIAYIEDNNTITAFTLPYNISHYSLDKMNDTNPDVFNEYKDKNIYSLITDAYEVFTNTLLFNKDNLRGVKHNISQYNALIIVHSGKSQDITRNISDIWPQAYHWYPFPDLGRLGVVVVSLNTTLGLFVHEVGHTFGLLDLYSRDNYLYGGVYSSMSYGAHLVNGSKPPHLFACEKIWLNWIRKEQILTVNEGESEKVEIYPLEYEKENKTLAVKIEIDEVSYYIIEYRLNGSKASYDEYLPHWGVLITKIDETRPSPKVNLYGYGVVKVIAIINGDIPFYDNVNGITLRIVTISDEYAIIEVTNTHSYPFQTQFDRKGIMSLNPAWFFLFGMLFIMVEIRLIRWWKERHH